MLADAFSQVDEIPRPTIKQTVLFRLPQWLFTQVTERARTPFGKPSDDAIEGTESSSSSEGDEITVEVGTESAPNGKPSRRGRKQRKVQ